MAQASRLGPSHHGPVAEVAAPATAPAPAPASGRRRLAGGLHRRPRLRLGLLLAGPVGWLVIAYLGSLVILFINAFWSRDAFTGLVIHQFTLDNFVALVENPL